MLYKPPFVAQYKEFIGPNCIHDFLCELEADARKCYTWYKNTGCTKVKLFSKFDELKHTVTNCHICKYLFTTESEKFADHNHYNGCFRGIICKTCNDKLQVNRKLMPVVFHNFKNYDSHVLCIAGFGAMAGWSFLVIPLTSDKYLSTMVNFHIDTITTVKNDKPLKVFSNKIH